MKSLCQICLTWLRNRGYLLSLLPNLSMGLDSQHYIPTSTSERTGSEYSVEAVRSGLLERLRSSVRAKMLAAGLAIGGAGAISSAPEKADAATMRTAEILPGSQVNEFGDDEFGFAWSGGQFRFTNVEDDSNRDVYWIGVRSMDDTEADAALSIPGHTPAPDRIIGPNEIPGDGIMSPDLILDGQLQVREDFFVAVGVDENGNTALGVDKFLESSEFFIGLSPIEGDPENIDEAMAMTNGVVYQGTAPGHLDPATAYVIRPAVQTPEPSTAVLGGLAAGGAAAAGLRRKRKNKQ